MKFCPTCDTKLSKNMKDVAAPGICPKCNPERNLLEHFASLSISKHHIPHFPSLLSTSSPCKCSAGNTSSSVREQILQRSGKAALAYCTRRFRSDMPSQALWLSNSSVCMVHLESMYTWLVQHVEGFPHERMSRLPDA